MNKQLNSDKLGLPDEENVTEPGRLKHVVKKQLNSGKKGLAGVGNLTELGGHGRVKKLDRHSWMAIDLLSSLHGSRKLTRLEFSKTGRVPCYGLLSILMCPSLNKPQFSPA